MSRWLLTSALLLAILTTGFVSFAPHAAYADDLSQTALEKQLKDIESQIAALQSQLAATQSAKQTLTKKIQQLQIQENKLRLEIRSVNLRIQTLTGQIHTTQAAISDAELKLERYQKQLTTLLLTLNTNEQTPLMVVFFSRDGMSAFFDDLQNYNRITNEIKDLTRLAKNTKATLEQKKAELANQQDDAKQLLSINLAAEHSLTDHLHEQTQLLQNTKGQEANYQTALADTKKRAAEIRSRLYELFGTTKQINFGDAVKIAQWVSGQTGVRTAFLLAILTQETSLGKNVGTCNRAGDPPEKSWRVVMKPDRDQEPFQTITSELGMNIDTTPISCPLKDKNGNQYGWGGAMGPAQFIPSTWMGYRTKVAAITGKTANPWDIRDAFIAAAIKLKSDGANGTDDGDWKAAMRYFSGSTNVKYRFYGDSVLELTHKYEKDIQDINQ